MVSIGAIAQTGDISSQHKDNNNTIDISNSPKRINDEYPLSVQTNMGK